MVTIYRGQRGLVQGQQIAVLLLPATHTITLYGQQHRSVLLPIGSLHILKDACRMYGATDLDSLLKLGPTGNCGVL